MQKEGGGLETGKDSRGGKAKGRLGCENKRGRRSGVLEGQIEGMEEREG